MLTRLSMSVSFGAVTSISRKARRVSGDAVPNTRAIAGKEIMNEGRDDGAVGRVFSDGASEET